MLDEKDMEFIDALQSLEVPRNVATLITYIANTNEVNLQGDRNWDEPEATRSEHRNAYTKTKQMD